MAILYRHEFRYRSLFQIWSGILTLALALACALAIEVHWVFAILMVLLLVGSAAVWIGVARNDVAWFELREETLAWSSSGLGAGSACIPYSKIRAVNLRNITESQSILVYLDDGDVVACSDLYFGNGIEILETLKSMRPELQLMLNDAGYYGDPSDERESRMATL